MSLHPRPLVASFLVAAVAATLAGTRGAQCELELQHLAPPDGQDGDGFAYRVERAGGVALIASTFDDDRGTDSGSAYVHVRDGAGTWQLARKLLPADGAAHDLFAYSIAVDGKTVLVGAPGHDGDAADAGAVYVFAHDQGGPGAWGELAHLAPPRASAGASFGYSLAVHGERLLVGAPHHGRGVPGRAYLYRRDPASRSGWTLELDFTSADPATALEFGQDVTLGAKHLAVSGSTTSVLPYSDSYVVHVRERDAGRPGGWGEVARIASPTGSRDLFAYEIALDGERLAVVAPGEWDVQTNVIGALYLYGRDQGGPGRWDLLKRVVGAETSFFTADEVDLHGDWLVAGTSGAVHVFNRFTGGPEAWGEVTRLEGVVPADLATFGLDLEVEGDELLVGAPGTYTSWVAGDAYLFDLARLARAGWRNDAAGVNLALHRAVTRPILGATYVAEVDVEASGHERAVLLAFARRAERVLPGGPVLLGEGVVSRTVRSGPLARFEYALPADAALCGLALVTQAVLKGGGLPFALTNAQDLVLGSL